MLGNLVAPVSGVVDLVLQGSLVVRERLRAAPKPQLLAEVVSSFPASATLAAGNTDLEGNAVTNLEALDFRPNGDDHTGRFMTQGEWLTSTEITVGELLVIAHIRTADAGLLDGNLELPDTWLFDGSCLLLQMSARSQRQLREGRE